VTLLGAWAVPTAAAASAAAAAAAAASAAAASDTPAVPPVGAPPPGGSLAPFSFAVSVYGGQGDTRHHLLLRPPLPGAAAAAAAAAAAGPSFVFPLARPDVAVLYIEVWEAPAAEGAAAAAAGGSHESSGESAGEGEGRGEAEDVGAGAAGAPAGSATAAGAGNDALVGAAPPGTFAGYFAAPVSCLRGGVRSMPLRDARGKKLPLATLLVELKEAEAGARAL